MKNDKRHDIGYLTAQVDMSTTALQKVAALRALKAEVERRIYDLRDAAHEETRLAGEKR